MPAANMQIFPVNAQKSATISLNKLLKYLQLMHS